MKVCFVAHFAYGAMRGGDVGHVGGVERQTSLMAAWLAARGHEISLLTWDEGQPDGIVLNGVRVYSVCAQAAGVPGTRFFHPRWSGLVKAMVRADADVYCQNSAECATGQVAIWCRRNGRRFVFSSANDRHCTRGLPGLGLRERLLYRLGLRWSDQVVVQSEYQRRLLRSHFSRDSMVLPMPCQGPTADEYVAPGPPSDGHWKVLWLGRVTAGKRPERLLEIARASPAIEFDLVGPIDSDPLVVRLMEEATQVPNLKVIGPVVRRLVPNLFRDTHCLVSTSDAEGFPNTYLEAWSYGIPVVAIVDPDGVITRHRLGQAATDSASLSQGLADLFAEAGQWEASSLRARQYYVEHHTVDAATKRFESLFRSLCS